MPWVRVTPRGQTRPAERCLRCEARIEERWEPLVRLCAGCALESDLFERDQRWERLAERPSGSDAPAGAPGR